MTTIEIYQNNNKTLTCTVTDANGDDYNVEGYTCTLTVRRSFGDLEAKYELEGTKAGNVITFAIPKDTINFEPGAYVFDVQVEDNDELYTVAQGILRVLDSVKEVQP